MTKDGNISQYITLGQANLDFKLVADQPMGSLEGNELRPLQIEWLEVRRIEAKIMSGKIIQNPL